MVDFYKFFGKVPGGSILIPLFLFAIIGTIFPDLWKSLGGMSQQLFSGGALVLSGLLMFASGATIRLKDLPKLLKRFGSLTVAKLVFGVGLSIAFIFAFGMDGVFGINAVAFTAVMCACNPGVYASVIEEYGEPEEQGMFAIMMVLTTPAIPAAIILARAVQVDLIG